MSAPKFKQWLTWTRTGQVLGSCYVFTKLRALHYPNNLEIVGHAEGELSSLRLVLRNLSPAARRKVGAAMRSEIQGILARREAQIQRKAA